MPACPIRLLTVAAASRQGGSYLAVAIIGACFVSLGVAMMLDIRGFGRRVVRAMAALGSVFGAKAESRAMLRRSGFFRVGWGVLALWFGGTALLIAILH